MPGQATVVIFYMSMTNFYIRASEKEWAKHVHLISPYLETTVKDSLKRSDTARITRRKNNSNTILYWVLAFWLRSNATTS